ncbi:MAG: hypothetical protein AB7U18_24870, partial [Dehalococcoidia bacterium]
GAETFYMPPAGGSDSATPASPGVASSLRELGERLHDADSKRHLLTLAAAIDGDADQADRWSQVEPQRLLDANELAHEVIEPSRSPRWIEIVELFRNAIILAPILLTWFGIHVAVNAYSDLLRERPEASEQTFLYLWQQGFDGRLTAWWAPTLGELAIYDVILIAIVIGATVVVGFVNHWLEEQRTSRIESERRAIRALLGDASLALAARRPKDMGAAVGRLEDLAVHMLEDMDAQRRQAIEYAQLQTRQAEVLTEFAQSLPELVADMRGSAAKLNEGTGQLSAEIGRIDAALAAMTRAMVGSLAGLAELNLVSVRLAGATERSANEIETLNGTTGRLLGMMQDVATNQERLSDGLRDAVDRSGRASSTLSETLTTLGTDTQTLAKTITSMDAAALRMVDGQERLLAQMADERMAQTELMRLVQRTTVDLDAALEALGGAAPYLRTLAVDARELTNDMPTVMTVVGGLRDAAQAQARAAEALVGSNGASGGSARRRRFDARSESDDGR